MTAPVQPRDTSTLTLILLKLGVLEQQIGEVGKRVNEKGTEAVALEERVRDIENWKAGVEASTKSSTNVWLFVWQAINTMATLGFVAAEYFTRGGH